MEEIDYSWVLKAERDYNNILTGDLSKEKEAYLRGVRDCFKEFSDRLLEMDELIEEIKDLKKEIEDLEEKIEDLESDLEEQKNW